MTTTINFATAPDEGYEGTVKIFWNVLSNPNLRQRVLQMRRNFQKQRHNIGYIVFWAKVLTVNSEQ